MKAALDYYKNGCTICIISDSDDSHHDIKHCPSLKPVWAQYTRLKSRLHYSGKKTSACFRCHVPQYNDRLHSTFLANSDEACEWPDTVVPVMFHVMMKSQLRIQASNYFGQDWTNENNRIEWLKAKTPVTGHATNPAALFLWFYENIQ